MARNGRDQRLGLSHTHILALRAMTSHLNINSKSRDHLATKKIPRLEIPVQQLPTDPNQREKGGIN